MHTVVVEMSTDPSRVEAVETHFREDIVPWAHRQPGFVAGQSGRRFWRVTQDPDCGARSEPGILRTHYEEDQ